MRLRRVIASITAAAAAATGLLAAPGVASAQSSCPVVAVVGIAGSNQGAAHGDSYNFGLHSGALIGRMRNTLDGAGLRDSVAYHAVKYDAKLDFSYVASKDGGYQRAYETVKRFAACGNTKIALVGYSQGAHIAGDLTNTIYNSNRPVSPDRLVGVALIADPGFNPDSAHVTRIGGGSDSGVAGRRDAWPSDAPVRSVCLINDIVCDNGARGALPDLRRTLAELVAAGLNELANETHTVGYLNAEWPDTDQLVPEYLGEWLANQVVVGDLRY